MCVGGCSGVARSGKINTFLGSCETLSTVNRGKDGEIAKVKNAVYYSSDEAFISSFLCLLALLIASLSSLSMAAIREASACR